MTQFLSKILDKHKLQENLVWEIDEKKEVIIDKLKKLTSENYYSGIFAICDLTAPKEKEFIGTISNTEFIIRKKIRMNEFFPNIAKVKAKFESFEGKTKITAKVIGMRTIPLFIRLLVLAFLSLLALLVVFEALIPPIGEVNPFPDIVFILIFASIFILFPYLLARGSVKLMKTEMNEIFGKK